MNTTLAKQQGYLTLCVDKNNVVLKSFGDTSKFLIPQNFNSNLAELLPKPLVLAFNNLRKDALKAHETASVGGIHIKLAATSILVRLSVTPLITKKGEQTLLLVTFTEEKTGNMPITDKDVFDEQLYYNRYTRNLEEEIEEMKTALQDAYTRLDAVNENMQSFNEELISANEEMQSTNEEMQSVNEELHTINAEYQLKNKELSEVNDDLNNYFRSNVNGQLFVDQDLMLMRFSPGAVQQINLMETDIGRPLSHISTNIKLETIIEDAKQVIADGSVITKEIENNNNLWYQVMTMPYIQSASQKIQGLLSPSMILQS